MKQLIIDMITLVCTVICLSIALALGGIFVAWLWAFL